MIEPKGEIDMKEKKTSPKCKNKITAKSKATGKKMEKLVEDTFTLPKGQKVYVKAVKRTEKVAKGKSMKKKKA